MTKLSPREKAFVTAYLKPTNNFNATQAYLATNPNCTNESAGVLAARMMQRPQVQEAIDQIQNKIIEKDIASREYLLKEAHEIGEEARNSGKLQTALNAVNQKARLNKIYDKSESGLEGYRNMLQTLIINGNVSISNNSEPQNVIDVPC